MFCSYKQQQLVSQVETENMRLKRMENDQLREMVSKFCHLLNLFTISGILYE